MKSYICAIVGVLLVVSGIPAIAQVYDEAPLRWHLDAGYAATVGRTADFLNDGFTIGGGIVWHPVSDAPFAVRSDFHYSHFDATGQLLTLGSIQNQTRVDSGEGEVLSLDVDGVYEVRFGGGIKAYVLAGVGIDYRRIDLTQTVAVPGLICDPWWGFCGPAVLPGQLLVNREDTSRFAWNVGVGAEFPMYGLDSWFVEVGYNRMATPSGTEFVPIRIGLRF